MQGVMYYHMEVERHWHIPEGTRLYMEEGLLFRTEVPWGRLASTDHHMEVAKP